MANLRHWQGTIFFTMLTIALLLTFSFYSSSTAFNLSEAFAIKGKNQTIPYLEKGMYLIVGAFQIPENAVQYAKSLSIKGKVPRVARYRENGYYYVYAYATKDNLEYARERRTELRATSQFYDSWILYVGIKLDDLLAKEEARDIVVLEQPKEATAEDIKAPETEAFIPPPPVAQDEHLYNYRFNVVNATTLKEVPGYITIVDAARNKAMRSVSTNQIHQLEAPKTQSKEIIALCDIFGYVIEQTKFKIDDPLSAQDKSMISESGGITTVKFELARHKIGDILTMYHVYFYTNSAIMKPESKFELNSLLNMLKENEKLEIKIHGHTNGNAAGKIIRLKEGDKNYFKVSPENEEIFGSAKELSKARAKVIMQWLIDQGIDEKRMDIKAWGGKKMIYKKTDELASKNVRVEIEILKT
ncbi:MAG: OmpA family protein [Cytophagales bacterium]|nr:OmpA family protein [Cytophagales bacterium]